MHHRHTWSCLGLLAFAISAASPAATLVVDTAETALADDGHCSLREALLAAETNQAVDTCAAGEAATADHVYFARSLAGQTFSLSGALTIGAGTLVIDGLGRQTILSAAGSDNALRITGGEVTLRGLEILATGSGSGVVMDGIGTQLTLEGCTVVGSVGIDASGTPSLLRVVTSTVFSSANSSAGGIAIRSTGANALDIANSTVVAGIGAGVQASASSGATLLYSSIFVGATPIAGTSTPTFSKLATTRAGAGLDYDLADHGGPTRTIALVGGSAIDGGDCASAPLPNFDQRYFVDGAAQTRQVGAACDAGAYEKGAVASTDPLFADAFEGY